MSTSNTLFSHLASRFTTHPENLATEGLLYLLTKSQNANGLFAQYLRTTGDSFNEIKQFSSQAFEDGAIPDLVGIDVSGNKIFIVENKFWAGLTDKQPLGYLTQLPQHSPAALFFVCPEKRLGILHAEVIRLINDSGQYEETETVDETEGAIVTRLPQNQYLTVVSWRRLLSDLDSLLDPIKERELIADLNQLKGLCEQMDYEGFIPLRPGETGDLEIPRRVIDYINLVDGLVQQLVETSEANISGLRATATANWIGRYMDLRKKGEFQALLAVDFSLWRKFGRSPIWLKFHYNKVGQANEVESLLSKTDLYINYVEENPRLLATPIYLTPNSDKQKVIEDSVQQIKKINRILLDN